MKILGTTVTQSLQKTEQHIDLQLKYDVDNKRKGSIETESLVSNAFVQKVSSSNDLHNSQIDRSHDRGSLRSVQSTTALNLNGNSTKSSMENIASGRNVDRSTVISLKRPRDSDNDRGNTSSTISGGNKSVPSIVLKKKSLTLSLTKPKVL